MDHNFLDRDAPRLFWLSVGLCGLLGLIHTGVTFVAYRALSPGAIWFAGTGLGMPLLTIVNVAAWRGVIWRSLPPLQRNRGHPVGECVGFFAVQAVPEPQAYLVLAAFSRLLNTSLSRAPFRATADE